MELALQNPLLRHILIDDKDSNVKGFGSQAELAVHIDDPLDQECARSVFDFCLHLAQVVHGHHLAHFLLLQVDEDILRKFTQVLRIAELQLVSQRQFGHHLLLHVCDALFEDLGH